MSRKTALLWATSLLAIALVFTLAGCENETPSSDAGTDGAGQDTEAVDPGSTQPRVGKGSPAPDFQLEKVGGGRLEYASLRGQVVLVDFWDTWCPPCRRALPHLQELSEQYANDVTIVGVALGREGKEKVRAYVEKNGLTFPMVLADSEFKIVEAFGGVSSIPTSFLINADGVIVEKWIGGMAKAEYEKGIRRALGL